MTEYPIPHAPSDDRLLDCLHHLSLTTNDLLHCQSLNPLLARELKTWARAKNLDTNHESLPQFAAFKLLTQPRAYTHVNQPRAYTHVNQQHTEQRA
jgi:hypothetical protein